MVTLAELIMENDVLSKHFSQVSNSIDLFKSADRLVKSSCLSSYARNVMSREVPSLYTYCMSAINMFSFRLEDEYPSIMMQNGIREFVLRGNIVLAKLNDDTEKEFICLELSYPSL